jgi:type I protein arginine methyltransferase
MHFMCCVQDTTRTGTYYWAMAGNASDFEGKVVADVGAGSGILSLFAAQVQLHDVLSKAVCASQLSE